jgi:hypothetical protein
MINITSRLVDKNRPEGTVPALLANQGVQTNSGLDRIILKPRVVSKTKPHWRGSSRFASSKVSGLAPFWNACQLPVP